METTITTTLPYTRETLSEAQYTLLERVNFAEDGMLDLESLSPREKAVATALCQKGLIIRAIDRIEITLEGRYVIEPEATTELYGPQATIETPAEPVSQLPTCRECGDFSPNEGALCARCMKREVDLAARFKSLSQAERRVLAECARRAASQCGDTPTTFVIKPFEIFPGQHNTFVAARQTISRLARKHGLLTQIGNEREFSLTERGLELGRHILALQAKAAQTTAEAEGARAE